MSLARRIRECRYALGWGPDDLADRARISRNALYQIERGKTRCPRAPTLRRLAHALGVDTGFLLGPSAGPIADAAPESRPTGAGRAPMGPSATGDDAEGRDRRAEDLCLILGELLTTPLGPKMARLIEEAHSLLALLEDRTSGAADDEGSA